MTTWLVSSLNSGRKMTLAFPACSLAHRTMTCAMYHTANPRIASTIRI